MASKNKKNKAKNSYTYNGGMKNDGMKLKRVQYFTKQYIVTGKQIGGAHV